MRRRRLDWRRPSNGLLSALWWPFGFHKSLVLQNKEFHNMCSSPDTIRMTKSRIVRCTGHVACMVRKRRRWEVNIMGYLRETVSRAIVRAFSRRLPTAAACVRSQIRSCGICEGRSGTGAGYLRVLRFPCQFSFRWLFQIHLLQSGAKVKQWPTY
jgi:hypothetical protein